MIILFKYLIVYNSLGSCLTFAGDIRKNFFLVERRKSHALTLYFYKKNTKKGKNRLKPELIMISQGSVG